MAIHIEIIGHINPRRRANCPGTHYYAWSNLPYRTYYYVVRERSWGRDMQFTPNGDSLLRSKWSGRTLYFADSDSPIFRK